MAISKKYKKDYSNSKFDNPRVAQKKERRKNRFNKFVYALIVVGVVGFLYVLFFSPFFQVKNLEINGLEKVHRENLEVIVNDYQSGSRRFFIFSKTNFWFIDKKDLVNKIEDHYAFEELSVKKRFPNKLVINLKEKAPAINWMVGNMCYHLDLSGMAIEYCENGEGLITIRDQVSESVEIGQSVVEAEVLDYIVTLDGQAKNILKDQYSPLFYEKNQEALIVKMETGPEIRFNCNIEVGEQVSRLDLLLKESSVKDAYESLNYIDLRFGEKVYYK